MVEVKVEGVGVATRKLDGKNVSELIPGAGPLSIGFEPDGLPVLRHRTMTAFVEKSANDKRSELLETLGLAGLSDFRRGVRSTAQKLKRLEKGAVQQLMQARRNLGEELAGESLSAVLRQLSHEGGLSDELTSESDLLAWQPDSSTLRSKKQRDLGPVEILAEANSLLQNEPLAQWQEAVADRQVAEQRGLSVLLNAGHAALLASEDDRCPLCLLDQDREQLLEKVASRARELAVADQRFDLAEAQMAEHAMAVTRLQRAVEESLENSGPGLEGVKSQLETYRDALGEYETKLRKARLSHSPVEDHPPEINAEILEALRRQRLSESTGIGLAMLRLSKLKGLVEAEFAAKAQALAAGGKHEAADAAATIADAHVERAVQQALDRINEPLAEYYGSLVGKPVYSDLKLTYTEGRTGGIEFGFKWNGEKDVKPPQRVMSESELNALGLALFLARLKTDPPAWRTLVLDDVITSFDNVHDARLVRLLTTDFSDWQVILLTHDQQLSRTVEAEASGWANEKVVAWTPHEGPSFGSGTMRGRLREKLDAGEPAAELGGLARQAMEEALERPLRKLHLKIRHDPQNIYSAEEYRQALVDGLTDGGFQKVEDPILQRLRSANSITNRACHFKDQMPGIKEADLRLLLDDLSKLDQLFECDGCRKKVWAVTQLGSRRCQCSCGLLSCA